MLRASGPAKKTVQRPTKNTAAMNAAANNPPRRPAEVGTGERLVGVPEVAHVGRDRPRGCGQLASKGEGVLFGREDAHVHAVRILSNAQLTADRYVADAQAYSHRLTEEARSRRDEILTEAQDHADMVLVEASNRASQAAIATLDVPEEEHLDGDRSALKAEINTDAAIVSANCL